MIVTHETLSSPRAFDWRLPYLSWPCTAPDCEPPPAGPKLSTRCHAPHSDAGAIRHSGACAAASPRPQARATQKFRNVEHAKASRPNVASADVSRPSLRARIRPTLIPNCNGQTIASGQSVRHSYGRGLRSHAAEAPEAPCRAEGRTGARMLL